MDLRIKKLAEVVTEHSCKIKAGNNVLIEHEGDSTLPMVKQLIKEIYKRGGHPFLHRTDNGLLREILLGADAEQLAFQSEYELFRMKKMDAFIAVRGYENVSELSDVPAEKLNAYDSALAKVLECRVKNTNWVLLGWPNPASAQRANMSCEAFEDYYFQVCTCDYGKMSDAMESLVSLMNKTDRVRILGPGTDLSFSIKGIPAIKCAGECNLPDGEVYTAPVRDSVNGVISYNTHSEYQGFTYDNVKLEIKDGKIIKAEANNTEKINALLDTDEGSRFFGEFALGVNPYVREPMNDILFDEKICGSFHFTPGMAYDDADNGNRSAVHWDLVMIQRPEYGGGEIYFDDMLIRKDGLFVLDELKCLNPENLL